MCSQRVSALLFLQDYLLPAEYVRVMQESMLDKCPVSTYEQISAVIQRELGLTPEQVLPP
jgi:aarF domain-containing kinase